MRRSEVCKVSMKNLLIHWLTGVCKRSTKSTKFCIWSLYHCYSNSSWQKLLYRWKACLFLPNWCHICKENTFLFVGFTNCNSLAPLPRAGHQLGHTLWDGISLFNQHLSQVNQWLCWSQKKQTIVKIVKIASIFVALLLPFLFFKD